ncbi:uncharacterized protein LOC129726491 [Wyeomyia smithii]|uniref:uncharacterized protein LOC129726491 n=1 Tax=Wyeomyia smithii TaxID=174621 RepID=UPI002467E77B|nr:uncharacterized protein LOC129726491 [Wyeomyia smithii]
MWLCISALLLPAILVCGADGTEEDGVINVVINPKHVINYISQEFVCFSAQPKNVFDGPLNPISDASFQMAKNVGPMYVKVFSDSDQLLLNMDGSSETNGDAELVQLTPNGWKAFDDWAEQVGVIPIFVLDYSESSWKPKHALKTLTVAHKLGIKDCLWQLGNGSVTNAVKYVEDLRALQLIVRAFHFWGMVASEVSPRVAGVEQARYFNLHVDDIADAIAVNFEPSSNDFRLKDFVLQREIFFKGPARSHLPVWLDAKLPTNMGSNGTCELACLQDGLQYATLLGDAARNGFDSLFKSLSREEIQFYSFNYLVALLHRTTIGSKVFDVRQASQEGSQFYAYCSRSGNGSLTMMAVNHLSDPIEFDIKLYVKEQCANIQEFILTAINGVILLNDETFDFNSSLEPLTKRQTLRRDFRLDLPPLSVGFWVIPELNIRECNDDYQELRYKYARSVTGFESSIDQLLQELIADHARQDVTQLSRRKRSLSKNLQDVLAGKLKSELQKKAKTNAKNSAAREPRQTKNFRRKQQVVRQKEKRMDQRSLKRQKRPLRDRGKRQLRKRTRRINRLAPMLASKKIKRSSLAETRNQTPLFGNSREEENNRSHFPQGDVHLVISKGSEDELLSSEVGSIRERRPKKSRRVKTTAAKVPSEEELRFIVPEVLDMKHPVTFNKRLPVEIDLAEFTPFESLPDYRKIHARGRNRDEEIDIKDIKIIEPSLGSVRKITETTARSINAGSTDPISYYQEPAEEIVESRTLEIEASPVGEDQLFSSELTLAMMPEDSGESAHVEEFNERRKRSLNSGEIDRIEAFFMNSTSFQRRFAEIVDMLLESIDCCEEEYVDDTVREDSVELPEQQLQRSKRNALLHPRTWESSDRTNNLHQLRNSQESHENMVPTEPISRWRAILKNDASTVITLEDKTTTFTPVTSASTVKNDEAPPGVTMLRTVTNFVKSVSSEFHQVISYLFPRTSTE